MGLTELSPSDGLSVDLYPDVFHQGFQWSALILLQQIMRTKNGLTIPISGTQKGLSHPPELAPIGHSARAIQKLQAGKTKVPNW